MTFSCLSAATSAGMVPRIAVRTVCCSVLLFASADTLFLPLFGRVRRGVLDAQLGRAGSMSASEPADSEACPFCRLPKISWQPNHVRECLKRHHEVVKQHSVDDAKQTGQVRIETEGGLLREPNSGEPWVMEIPVETLKRNAGSGLKEEVHARLNCLNEGDHRTFMCAESNWNLRTQHPSAAVDVLTLRACSAISQSQLHARGCKVHAPRRQSAFRWRSGLRPSRLARHVWEFHV